MKEEKEGTWELSNLELRSLREKGAWLTSRNQRPAHKHGSSKSQALDSNRHRLESQFISNKLYRVGKFLDLSESQFPYTIKKKNVNRTILFYRLRCINGKHLAVVWLPIDAQKLFIPICGQLNDPNSSPPCESTPLPWPTLGRGHLLSPCFGLDCRTCFDPSGWTEVTVCPFWDRAWRDLRLRHRKTLASLLVQGDETLGARLPRWSAVSPSPVLLRTPTLHPAWRHLSNHNGCLKSLSFEVDSLGCNIS